MADEIQINLNAKLDNLENQLKEIQTDMRRLQECLGTELSNLYVHLEQLLKSQNLLDEAESTYSIKNKDELVKLQEKLKDSKDDIMVKIVQKLIRRAGLPKILQNLLAEDIIKSYDCDGLPNKESFKHFYHVESLFFKALEPDAKTYAKYKRTMRKALKFEKQKLLKEQYLKEKKKKTAQIIKSDNI